MGFYQIMNWKNENYSENIVHIQGDSDLILPHNFVKIRLSNKRWNSFYDIESIKEIETIIIENLL